MTTLSTLIERVRATQAEWDRVRNPQNDLPGDLEFQALRARQRADDVLVAYCLQHAADIAERERLEAELVKAALDFTPRFHAYVIAREFLDAAADLVSWLRNHEVANEKSAPADSLS